MAAQTIGFAVSDTDKPRLERLVKKYGRGNRSEFLRVAIDRMEAAARAEELRELQAYGAERMREQGISPEDIDEIVHRALEQDA